MKKQAAKKVMSVALAGTMAAAMLAGCGSSDSGSTTSADSSAATETSQAADSGAAAETTTETADGKTVISVYRAAYNVADTDPDELQLIQDEINNYIGDKINVEVEIHDINNAEYGDKANLALNNGEVNLLWTANWWSTIGTNDLIKQGAAYEITDLLASEDGQLLYNSMPEWYWQAAQYDGKDYFIPVYKEGAEGYEMKFLDSNLELIGATGEEIAADVDAVEGATAKLKAIEPYFQAAKDAGVKYPLALAGTPMFYRWYIDQYDFVEQSMFSLLAVDHDKNEVVNTIQTQDYKDYCELMTAWGEAGILSAEDELGGVISASITQTQDWLGNFWTAVPNDKESEGRDGNQAESFVKISDNWGSSHTTLGSCFAISASSTEEEAEACIKFLGLLFTDTTVANLYTYGIEGTDYVITDGKVDRTQEGTGTLYNHSPWESTSVAALTLEVGEPDDKVEMYDTFNGSAKSSPANGFRFDISDTELAAKVAACIDVYNEYGKTLELGGASDVEAEIEAFQEALDGAGYQDVLAEAQAQYEAWKAN